MMECEDCGWLGTQEDCIETHQGDEIVYGCPKCGSVNLVGLEGEGAELLVPA